MSHHISIGAVSTSSSFQDSSKVSYIFNFTFASMRALHYYQYFFIYNGFRSLAVGDP